MSGNTFDLEDIPNKSLTFCDNSLLKVHTNLFNWIYVNLFNSGQSQKTWHESMLV